MKVNLKKIGAVVAGATILASSAAFAGLMFGSTTLVDDNGAPVAKVVVGSNAMPSDGVAAALIAGKMVSEAYKSATLTAQVSGTATCSGDANATGTCAISNEKAKLEITVPDSVATGTWTGASLIGDFINRDLNDRVHNDVADNDVLYPLTASETSESANPFTDNTGAGTDLASSPSDDEVFYKVDGSDFTPFADADLSDDDAGDSYTESQALWIQGDGEYNTGEEELVGHVDLLVYSIRFDGPGGDEAGIPVCTSPENTDYTFCKTGDGNLDYATETHKVNVYFLGESWVISEMNPPTDATADEDLVQSGGSIKLAKEAVSGILNQGESLPVDGYKFQLDDLEAHGDQTSAILSVLDANGNILKKDKVEPGETKEFNIEGQTYRFHVYKVAPGYTFGAKWADVAIFSEELELEDGEELNKEEGDNEGYYVTLGWKNYDAEADDGDADNGEEEQPDALRTIILYAETPEDVISSGEDFLLAGDYIPIVQDPVAWKLTFQGLDLTTDDYFGLSFSLETGDKTISANKMADNLDCTIAGPYVEVSSDADGGIFEVSTFSDNEFYVTLGNDFTDNLGGGLCDALAGGATGIGAIVMQESSSSGADYNVVPYVVGSETEVGYSQVGDGEDTFTTGGSILIEQGTTVNAELLASTIGPPIALSDDEIGALFETVHAAEDTTVTGGAGLYFAVSEHAGNDYVNYWIFGVDDYTDTTDVEFQFDTDAILNIGGTTVLSDDRLLYGHATPNGDDFYVDGAAATVSGPVDSGVEMVEEGYVSERGTVLKSFDSDEVKFDMTHTLGHLEWFLASSATSADDASTTIWTGGEGESTTVSGVTVKVLEITETVGACSAAGGAPACTADMTGVTAVIMPNNAASVTVAMPYTGSYGNLVVLDTDAVGVNTLVSVGGDKVNSVTAGLLQGTPVDWTAETKVVREVVQGSKIVVAGKDASDTLEAASDFVAQVQKV